MYYYNMLYHTALVQGWLVGRRLAAMRKVNAEQNEKTSVLGNAVLGKMILGG